MSEWLVTELGKVNAFVADGQPIPDPSLYDDGYSLALGDDADHRVRIEVRRTSDG